MSKFGFIQFFFKHSFKINNDGTLIIHNDTYVCHSRESGNPLTTTS